MSASNSTSGFCGGSQFWDDNVLSGDAPSFTPCFQDTILVYIPFGWIVLTFPFYLRHLTNKPQGFSLPLTPSSVVRSLLCAVLAILILAEVWAHDTYGYLCTDQGVPVSYYLGCSIRIVVFIVISAVIQLLRKKNVHNSGILYTFWVLLTLSSIIPLQYKITFHTFCISSILYYVYVGFVVVQLVLHSFADSQSRAGYQFVQEKVCPEQGSSVLNKITFWWLNDVVVTAYKRTIGISDLWDQAESLKSDVCISELEEQWQLEVQRCKKSVSDRNSVAYKRNHIPNGNLDDEKTPLISHRESVELHDTGQDVSNKPSLYRVLIRTYWREWLFASFLRIVDDVFALAQPFLLKYIIDVIENKDENYIWKGVSLAVLFFIAGVGETIFFSQAAYRMMRLGLRIKTAIIGLIYQKALTMSNASKKNYTAGDIVNLMSVDCQRIQDAFQFQYEVLSFFFMMSMGLLLVWQEMGVATLGSVVVIIIISTLNVWFGKLQQLYQKIILATKNNRIRLLKEVLSGIKVLKMYTWEPFFSSKILDVRAREMKYLKKVATVTAFSVLFSVHSPFFMNISILLLYVSLSASSYLSAQKVFVALSTVNILRFPLTITPFVITGVTQLFVSVGRIQEFLWKDDLIPSHVNYPITSAYAVSIEDGTFTWDKDDASPTLKDIDIKVPEGKLVAIVGQVGSGKSSLVSAVLGELEKLSGSVNIKGSIAYVPQEAWIQNLTVRDNILFGEKYKERKYNKVIKACALLPDLAILSAGDQTEIGEKGINVSGGQKQRISLARAVYSNSDIYLLDDPLSAVDSHVGKELFSNVIGHNGLLKNKTRILITHGVHWLPMVDNIIVMDAGRIREVGSYEELLQHKGAFAKFLQTYLLQEEEKDSDDEDSEITKMKDEMWERVESVLSDYEGLSAEEGVARSRRKSLRRTSYEGYSSGERKKSIVGPDALTRRASKISQQRQISERQTELVRSISERKIPKLHRTMSEARILPYDEEHLEEETKAGSLITQETAQVGSVNFEVFSSYIKAMGTFGALLPILSITVFQGLNVYGNYFLTYWTEDDVLKNQSLRNSTQYRDRNIYYLSVYSLLGLLQGLFLLAFAIIGLHRLIRASGTFHSRMLACVMRSPMSFFDTTPIGRIINRFSSDIDILDDRLLRTYRLFNSMFFSLLGILIVISINTPVFLTAIVPVGALCVLLLRFYLPTARQLKRIESVTRSPIYNHFSETISGSASIRAYKATDRFIEESQRRVDRNSAFYFAAVAGSWWMCVRLEFLGNLLVLAAALFSVLQTDIEGGDVGLSLTYSMQTIIAMDLVVQAVSEMEMNVVSAERVQEYTKLRPEAEWIIPEHRPHPSWPTSGSVMFNDYTTRYRPGLDLVLRGVNCSIQDGEKIGIVGRTGAGKSSLTLSLFRLIEAAGGGIVIDGVQVSEIGLHDLRSKVTILPQDPVLFSGPLKMNVDPLGMHTDSDIWLALERAHLKSYVSDQPGQLFMECGEGGGNLSVGQRQLVCLARTLLNKTKILILDEATAAVDLETDELIQETIRTEFSECTVLTIAHRINTVMDYDRIMVLDKGLIVEFDSPKTLLSNASGIFYKMAKDANLVN